MSRLRLFLHCLFHLHRSYTVSDNDSGKIVERGCFTYKCRSKL